LLTARIQSPLPLSNDTTSTPPNDPVAIPDDAIAAVAVWRPTSETTVVPLLVIAAEATLAPARDTVAAPFADNTDSASKSDCPTNSPVAAPLIT